ncbi:hypothetical protein QEZ54_00790 [Catellatospora sp. KI3]|uniref:FtsX-like permease family protein n=1 Tax=Catellatospora sp. KI3 TaxID=3041620 RepID=UPI002482AFD2|nr:FtsX-like permease family protein [Catellatospora sp. KI3]MDI1459494.1 hypothetical protein [Catellatospora sp. KI3]
MTALLWSMMKARRGLAAITLVLTAMAAAAAAAGPIYQAAATVSLRGVEVRAAGISEQALVGLSAGDSRGFGPQSDDTPTLPYVPGFTTIGGSMIEGTGVAATGDTPMFLVWRAGACEHLKIVKGRCVAGEREVVLREDVAARIGASAGGDFTFTPPASMGGRDRVAPQPLTVVGLYARPAVSDPFWVGRPALLGLDGTAVFTSERTVSAAAPDPVHTVDLLVSADAFRDLDTLRDDLEDANAQLEAAGYGTDSDLPDLIARVDAGEAQLAASLLLAVVPLVLLCWLVLFITVAGGVEQRRGELGLTALRGVPGRTRWLLASAETAAPVLLALIPGYLLGYAVTALLARFVLPGSPPVEPGWTSMAYAAVAVFGALAAGLLAQVRALTTPVLGLLRRARVRRRGGLVGGVEVAVGALALVAGYQVAAGGAGSGGVGLLAPLCVSLGLGLIAARAVGVPAERYGRRALRKGRLRTGLAALSLARGSGTHWIVMLLTVVFGLLGFAVTARDVADRAWQDRALVEGGAARVLSVTPLPVPALLHAVRTADPEGRYAMAAARVNIAEDTKVLAVDSARLGAAALWPASYGAMSGADAGKLLRPRPVQPLLLQAKALQVTVTLADLTEGGQAAVTLRLTSTKGSLALARVDKLRPGTGTYRIETPYCADAPCLLKQVQVDLFTRGRYRLDVTVGGIADGDGKPLLTAAQLAGHQWRLPAETAARPVPEMALSDQGMRLTLNSVLTPDIRVYADSAPAPLPVVASGDLPDELSAYAGTVRVPVTRTGTLNQVPRYGVHGVLVDLEYVDMRLGQDSDATDPEVWLAAGTPASVIEKLGANGLVIVGERTVADQRRLYGQQAPALALWFLAAAAFTGIVFAAGGLLVTAVLERGRTDNGLAVLRGQGLPAGVVRGASLGGRWALVGAGSLVGLLAAAGSWLLASRVVPVFSDGAATIPTASLPDAVPVLVPVAVALLVLLTTCVVATKVAAGADRKVA